MRKLFTLGATVAVLTLLSAGNAAAQQAASKPAAKPAAGSTAKPAAKPMAKPAWTADQIKEAQTGLQKAGFYKGEVNGNWDDATTAALKAWQKANKLKETGKLTNSALTKLKA